MTDADLRRVAFGVGYRMLGSRAEADDIAQETMLRIEAPIAGGAVDNPEAYTTTVATRLAVDELRSARRRRETYVGPWLPEPIVEWGDDPAETADELSYALLVVLDTLNPHERAAFLLRDVFGFGYDEIGRTLDRSAAASRQLASRARRRVAAHRPASRPDRGSHRRLVEQFLAVCHSGDVDAFVDLLADDVRLVSDGGANQRAARHPIVGRDRVTRFLASVFPRLLAVGDPTVALVNGEPGFVVPGPDGPHLVAVVGVRDDRIGSLSWVLNPDKVLHAAAPPLPTTPTATRIEPDAPTR